MDNKNPGTVASAEGQSRAALEFAELPEGRKPERARNRPPDNRTEYHLNMCDCTSGTVSRAFSPKM